MKTLNLSTVVMPNGFLMAVNNDDPMADQMRCGFSYEQNHVAAFFDAWRQPGGFIDIGASWGYWCIRALDCGKSPIVAVEANPMNLVPLGLNLTRMMEWPRLLPFIAGNDNAIRYVSGSSNTGQANRRSLDEPDDPTAMMVPTVRLDDFLGDVSLGGIKLDIEGYEFFAIQGMVETIKRCRPVIVSEFSALLLGQYHVDPLEFLAYMIKLGYKIGWTSPEPSERFDVACKVMDYRAALSHDDILKYGVENILMVPDNL